MKILLCGHRSMASQGLIPSLLQNKDVELDCFSRGEVSKKSNVITGDVFQMKENPYLTNYDVVINFIIIKGDYSIKKNLDYLKSLVEFCKDRNIKKLVHISTISVYPNDALYIDELSEIEKDITHKGVYASMKVECDKYLMSCENDHFKVVFIRPGYVVTNGEAVRWAGIMVALPLDWGALLGNKKTSLPLVERSKMIKAITSIILSNHPIHSFLLLENKGGTKYQYIKKYTSRHLITLNKPLVMNTVKLMKILHIISFNRYYQFAGLFKKTVFNSSRTEELLNIKF